MASPAPTAAPTAQSDHRLNRRRLLTAGIAGAGAVAATTKVLASEQPPLQAGTGSPSFAPLVPRLETTDDATAIIQAALMTAADTGQAVHLPPGEHRVGSLQLPPGTILTGSGHRTRLSFIGGDSLFEVRKANDVTIADLTIDLRYAGQNAIAVSQSERATVARIIVQRAGDTAIRFERSSGRIEGCRIADTANAGIFALDSTGLDIRNNVVTDSGNNAIQVWRSQLGEDGTVVTGNRIADVSARAGGHGEYGNGINVFRAGNVQVLANHISDCAFTAVRANSASNVQIAANACHRCGEVAIYAEFAFQGAVIANNLIDTAATGISVTNFNDGGRLAVVDGNVVRNLFRREHEPIDKRGIGISVEADTTVTGNTIEGAPTAGIHIGHHAFMRDVAVTSNVVRSSRHGILVSSDPDAGACLIANNLISGATAGAIKAHRGGAPVGVDLSRTTTQTDRIAISANLAV